MLIELAEKSNLKIMKTFFDCNASMKWTWKFPNSEIKNEIYFVFTNKLNTVKKRGNIK